MAMDLPAAEALLRDALGRVFPAAQLVVRWRGRPVLARAHGWLDPEARERPTRVDTLFDLASVTKLFVVSAFMALVERGTVGIHDPVRSVLPELARPAGEPASGDRRAARGGAGADHARQERAGAIRRWTIVRVR